MSFRRTWPWFATAMLATCWIASISDTASAQQKKPNILVIWGDDIGTWNISHNNRGMMGYQTPNIDRIAREGVAFTDYYDWMIDRAFVLVPLQAMASQFLMSMKEFPPSQTPGDWSLDSLEKQIKNMTTAGE